MLLCSVLVDTYDYLRTYQYCGICNGLDLLYDFIVIKFSSTGRSHPRQLHAKGIKVFFCIFLLLLFKFLTPKVVKFTRDISHIVIYRRKTNHFNHGQSSAQQRSRRMFSTRIDVEPPAFNDIHHYVYLVGGDTRKPLGPISCRFC